MLIEDIKFDTELQIEPTVVFVLIYHLTVNYWSKWSPGVREQGIVFTLRL